MSLSSRKMVVHRFMSDAEYQSLINGKVLYNNTNHRKKNKQRSSSVGFCFFIEDPNDAVRWLGGVVDLDWCVTMEVDNGFLIQSCGMYADENKWQKDKVLKVGDSIPMVKRKEYCRCRYSLKDVKILKATQMFKSMCPSKKEMKCIIRSFVARGWY